MTDRDDGPAAGAHPPMTHAAALDWCAALHPKAGVPKETCHGPLRLAGSAAGATAGSPAPAEVAILVCRDCGAELAIGRGLTTEARILGPDLHGRLLWIGRPGEDAFDFIDPEFHHLADGPAPAPADGPGSGELAEALEELRRSGVAIAELARVLIDQVERQGHALGRLHGLIGPPRSG